MKCQTKYLPQIALAVFMLVLGACYATQSDGKVMFDDELQISLVHSYRSVADTFGVDCFHLFRPVKNLIFYTWVNVWPDNIQVWRLSAIVLFLGLLPVVYKFFGIFFPKKPWLQAFASVAWASAPAMTSVVSWISSTNIIISGYGFLLYFLLYERTQSETASQKPKHIYSWQALSVLSLFVACLSYEAAMTATFLVFLRDFLSHPGRFRKRQNRIFYLLSVFVLIAYFVLRHNYGGANTIDFALSIPSDSKLWLSLGSSWFYIVHALRWLWPFGQQGISIIFNPEEHKALIAVSLVCVICIGILIVSLRNKEPKLAFGLAAYALALFPMANVLPLKNGPICDYYLFFPSFGLVLVLVECFQLIKRSQHQRLLMGIASLWLISCIGTTALWTPHWKSREALSLRTLEWQPDNYVLLAFLAEGALFAGDMEASKAYLDTAFQSAPEERKYRYFIEYLNSLWLGKSGHYQASVDQMESIAEDHRANDLQVPVHYLNQMAYVYDIYLEDVSNAEARLKEAMDLPWDYAFSKSAAIRLADIYSRTSRISLAAEVYQLLGTIYPEDASIAAQLSAYRNSKKPVDPKRSVELAKKDSTDSE